MKYLLLGMGVLAIAASWRNRAQVGVVVVDEATGAPIADAKVTGSFEMQLKPVWKNTGEPNLDKAVTDAEGKCRLSGVTDLGKAWCFVRPVPEGYYGWNGVGFEFDRHSLTGGWLPDNLVSTIRLDRIEHPVPLIVREAKPRFRGELAKCPDGKCAYDLMVGDWLPPFGEGEVADLEVIRLPRKDYGWGRNGRGDPGESFRDTVRIRFPGADNGLVEMHPRRGAGILIRKAPEDGYQQDYELWRERGLDLQWRMSEDRNRHFAFRIRTRRDAEGRIVEAYYGKIYRDFTIYVGNKHVVCGVAFLYYLNPDSCDRNLEWNRDMRKIPKASTIALP